MHIERLHLPMEYKLRGFIPMFIFKYIKKTL